MTLRAWPFVFGAALLGAMLSGCTLFGDPEAEAAQEARNNAEVAAIRDRLASMPGVVEVKAGWADNFTTAAEAYANLRVKAGSDLEHYADLAAKEIWRSKITPLKSIRVGIVSDTEDSNPGIIRSYIVSEQKAELEAKFGLRPVPDE